MCALATNNSGAFGRAHLDDLSLAKSERKRVSSCNTGVKDLAINQFSLVPTKQRLRHAANRVTSAYYGNLRFSTLLMRSKVRHVETKLTV